MRASWSMRQILLAAAPIAIAVFVFGASFGVLAVAAHLPAWSVVMMSALVFAGSAQFAALGAIAAGGSALIAVFARAPLHLRFVATGLAVAGAPPPRPPLRPVLGPLSIGVSC